MAQRPQVDIQVLQFAAGAHAAESGGHFVILGRNDERNPLDTQRHGRVCVGVPGTAMTGAVP
ncbi:hypothetical protein [Streptomyces celluloflavus]